MSSERSTSERLAFERIRVGRLPGFERQGFELSGLSPEINVVHGPNASGKTTAARALRYLLWPPEDSGDVALEGEGRLGERKLVLEIDHGRVERRLDGAPIEALALPPPEQAERYRLALHEILQEGARGEDLARQVAREALGGYDVDAAAEALGALEKVTHARKADAAFKSAEARVRELVARQAELERQAEGLDDLRSELREAREARRERDRIAAVLAWLDAEERLAEAERALAGYPPAVARVTGDERDRLEHLAAEVESARAEREGLERRLREVRGRLGSAVLPPEGVDEELLERLELAARDLGSVEQERRHAEQELAAARTRRERARNALGGRATAPLLETVGEGAWQDLVALARRAERLGAGRAALDAEAATLGEEASEDDGANTGALEQGAAYLRAWLRFSAGTPRARIVAAVALGLLLGAGIAGGLLVHPGLWGLAGAALLLALWVESDARDQRRMRAELEARYTALGLEAPVAWKRQAVDARAEVLERRWRERRLESERVARREERRRALAEEDRRLTARETALRAERLEMLERWGLAPELDRELEPAPLAALAQALGLWREADADVAAREAVIGGLRRREESVLARLGAELEDHGVAAPTESGGALAAVEELRRRSETGREIERIQGEDGELGRLDERLERLERERDEVYGRLELEPGDDAGLRALVGRLDAYRKATRERDEARGNRDAAAGRLPEGTAVEGRSATELEVERDLLAERAERHDDLFQEITRLETRIGQAKAQHELEEALADRERAEEDLRVDRRRVAAGRVAHELADWLKGQVRTRHRPEVMRRAAELFAEITRGRFRLLDPTGELPAFGAFDSAAERSRALDELSSGTRLQLLAAVRLAFIEVHERGVRPPLVLDETLANSDDASARALIEAAVDVARSGRQVFYFTAQEDEVAKWRAVLEGGDGARPDFRVIDLAKARSLEAGRRAPRRSWKPSPPAVPAPEGRRREGYAELLSVPGIDPWAEPGAVHLAHLVEEPEILHGLLLQGITHWGQLAALAEGGAGENAPAGLTDEGGDGEAGRERWRRIRARGRCVEALLRAWRQGRGESVDRRVLVASGAVTDRFLDEVSDLAASLGGDAGALLTALAEGRVKGFRSDKREQLEEYLADHGHLDERPVLDRAALRERAMAALAAEIESGDLAARDVDELLAQLPEGVR